MQNLFYLPWVKRTLFWTCFIFLRLGSFIQLLLPSLVRRAASSCISTTFLLSVTPPSVPVLLSFVRSNSKSSYILLLSRASHLASLLPLPLSGTSSCISYQFWWASLYPTSILWQRFCNFSINRYYWSIRRSQRSSSWRFLAIFQRSSVHLQEDMAAPLFVFDLWEITVKLFTLTRD